jgi:hypothetical protein
VHICEHADICSFKVRQQYIFYMPESLDLCCYIVNDSKYNNESVQTSGKSMTLGVMWTDYDKLRFVELCVDLYIHF